MEEQVHGEVAHATYRITLTRRELVCSMTTSPPLQTHLLRAHEIATSDVCTDSQAISRAMLALEEEKDEICAYHCIEDCAWLVHGVRGLGKFMWMVVHVPRGCGKMVTTTSWLTDPPLSHVVMVAHGEISIERVNGE
jgi:hypothetical protein